jgi:hypothetical protein
LLNAGYANASQSSIVKHHRRRYNKLFKYVTTAKSAVSTGRQKAPPFNRTLDYTKGRYKLNLDSLANNPLISIGSLALGMLGVLLAIVFYIRAQKNKTPCFDYSNNTLIEGLHKALDGLEVRYKGVSQERITITKVVFWNDGRETIDRQDLVQKDPLRIVCPNNLEVLDVQVVSDNADLNSIVVGEVEAKESSVEYPISFEYLDHQESFVVQLIHNGDSSVEFCVEGKIKGVKSIATVMDTKVPLSFLKYVPFMGPFEKIMSSPLFFKYIGSLTYFLGAMFALWNIITGNTQWYVWLAIPLCLLFSGVMYFNFRHISPVKI